VSGPVWRTIRPEFSGSNGPSSEKPVAIFAAYSASSGPNARRRQCPLA